MIGAGVRPGPREAPKEAKSASFREGAEQAARGQRAAGYPAVASSRCAGSILEPAYLVVYLVRVGQGSCKFATRPACGLYVGRGRPKNFGIWRFTY
eukprot:296559-Prymnesium_polylepis.1